LVKKLTLNGEKYLSDMQFFGLKLFKSVIFSANSVLA